MLCKWQQYSEHISSAVQMLPTQLVTRREVFQFPVLFQLLLQLQGARCLSQTKSQITTSWRSVLHNNIYVIRYNPFSSGAVSNSTFTASELWVQSLAFALKHVKP